MFSLYCLYFINYSKACLWFVYVVWTINCNYLTGNSGYMGIRTHQMIFLCFIPSLCLYNQVHNTNKNAFRRNALFTSLSTGKLALCHVSVST
ncbi:hypothetical protein GDO78_003029 [Eleutherodactylus coqui]|uniref:Uncharacterized protein n=1 Tax=Eleutherodactylus coqui TaxID=57060 RepID=A0A8J6EWM4_ELECQ|nr:hypothetical protein GDO78_003029 [Eleutherodactylus coqui]